MGEVANKHGTAQSAGLEKVWPPDQSGCGRDGGLVTSAGVRSAVSTGCGGDERVGDGTGATSSGKSEEGTTQQQEQGSAGQNEDVRSSSKQRRDILSSAPRQTRASQLRIQSHSVPSSETNPPQAGRKSGTATGTGSEAAAAAGPATTTRSSNPQMTREPAMASRRPPSRSTSSDDGSEVANSSSASDDRGTDGAPKTHLPPARGSSSAGDSRHPAMVMDTSAQAPVSPYGTTEKYLTPLQQKDRHNRELSVRVAKLEQIVQDRDSRLGQFEDEKQRAVDEMRRVKDAELAQLLDEIKQLQAQLRQSECSLAEAADSLDGQRKVSAALEDKMKAMEKEQEEKEAVHQQRYLDMYQKGREAQLIDQEEDLVCMAIAAAPGGDGKTRRLVKKLEETEQELEKLRQTFREDVYHKSPPLGTDSAAQVEILKSAVYYYLTDTQPEVNLSAIMSMLNYSDVQRRNIVSHLKKKLK